jgi:hypothetical protein
MHFSSPSCVLHVPHLIVLDLILLIIYDEAYELRSSSLCGLLQPAAISSLLGPNNLASTLNLCSSLSVRDHSYETFRKMLVFLR